MLRRVVSSHRSAFAASSVAMAIPSSSVAAAHPNSASSSFLFSDPNTDAIAFNMTATQRNLQQQRRFKVYTSPRGDLTPSVLEECRTKGLNQLWFEACETFADKKAFTDAHTGVSMTFNQTAALSLRVAELLKKHNIQTHDVVCIFSPNTILYGAWCHGILARGAVISPANPAYSIEDLRRHLELSRAKVVFTLADTPFAKVAEGAVRGLSNVAIITMSVPATAEALTAAIGDDAAALSTNGVVRVGVDDVIALPFSSGTTGLPKGVQLTNTNIVTNCKQIVACLGLKPTNSFLNILPYYHIYGFTACLQVPVFAGCHQLVMSKFDLHLYRESIPQNKISHLFIAPPIAVMLAKCPDLPKVDTSSVELILSGAAPLAEEVQALLQPRFPKAQIIQGYGLTETSPVTHFTDVKSNQNGSIGPLLQGTEARLVNAEGKDVEQGRQGEIWIRGPQVMKGYLNKEDTAVVFSDDGKWFKTGDIGRCDEKENFFITDRIKELVKYNGLQVPPAELEGILFSHNSVKDCLVFGVPDVNYGELPTAHVVLEAGVEPSVEVRDELSAYVNNKVANHKRLRGGVRFVQAIPKTASGKLLRRTAKESELKLRAEEKAAHHHH